MASVDTLSLYRDFMCYSYANSLGVCILIIEILLLTHRLIIVFDFLLSILTLSTLFNKI